MRNGHHERESTKNRSLENPGRRDFLRTLTGGLATALLAGGGGGVFARSHGSAAPGTGGTAPGIVGTHALRGEDETVTDPGGGSGSDGRNPRPNILFAIADDWSWPHCGVGGDPVVKTPVFDRVAREGVLFRHAFVSSPSCTPSRGAIATGQWHWRLEDGANLHSTLAAKFPVYPDLLEAAGYHVGYTRKGWGPGRVEPGGRTRNPAGPRYKDFDAFLKARPEGAPFCFWFGSHDPHRGYKKGSGKARGMDPSKVKVPACFPDVTEVREDLCDYFFEVERFDREVGMHFAKLEALGELDRTLVVITGDNGLPFPRCKSNLYDTGTRVPLAARFGEIAAPGRVVDDFISLTDLAPTFLEAAGLPIPEVMTGRSFLDLLRSETSGWVDPKRDRMFHGKERHAWVREGGLGYPCRAVRTKDFLYIRNYKPDRWPAGDPVEFFPSSVPTPYGDVDNSPTKSFMLEHREDPAVDRLAGLAFDKRPAEELYDLRTDPEQLVNKAGLPEYGEDRARLARMLEDELKATGDPRVTGEGERFEKYAYHGGMKKKKS